jgi:hypothetical protein
MAYTPSYNDIADLAPTQASASAPAYQPSYNDIADLVPNQQPQSMLDKINSTIAPAAVGAKQFAGDLLSGVGSTLNDIRNIEATGIPSSQLQGFNPAQAIQNAGNQMSQSAPSQFNLPNPTVTQQGVEDVARYLPYALQGGMALKDLGTSALNFATGKNVENIASSIYKFMSGGKAPQDLNNQSMHGIAELYSNDADTGKADIAAQKYAQIENNAAQAGYATSGSPGISGIDMQSPGKFIQPNETTGTIIDKAPGENVNKNLLSNVSSSVNKAIDNYNSSPTYQNAHTLQSILGNEAASLNSGLRTGVADTDTAALLTKAREALRNDIPATFIKNGDYDLAKQYQDATDYYRQEVAPYKNVPQIWNAINGKTFNGNIANVLAKDDTSGNLDTIRKDIQANPQLSQSVVAQSLGQGLKNVPDNNGNFQIKSSKLLSNYNNMPANVSQMMHPTVQETLDNLQSSAALRGKLLKYGASTVGAAGAGATAYKYLEGK